MRKLARLLLLLLTVAILGGCGATDAMDSSTQNATAQSRATRIAALSQKLDSYEAMLESIDYGSSVKKKLKVAQSAESKAIAKQNTEAHFYNLNTSGDTYIDRFEKALNELQNAMNSDKAVRKEVERQNSYSAGDETANLFGEASGKMMKLFLILAAVIIAIIIALSVLGKSVKKQSKNTPAQDPAPVEETAVATEEVTISHRSELRDTSDERFNKECEELGHNPEEVLSYFSGDINKAKTYISMEKNLKNQGIEKTYQQLYEESEE